MQSIPAAELSMAKQNLKNWKLPCPNATTGEESRQMDDVTITKNLKKTIASRDQDLTNVYLVHRLKPGKDPSEPKSYRPAILLYTYRKLQSQIILYRINEKIHTAILKSQFTCGRALSTGDVVLAHNFLSASTK